MAKQDLVFQPDFEGVARGLKMFHVHTKYPLSVKLTNGRVATFNSYTEYHLFISKMCHHYKKTGQKHYLAS